MHSGKKSIAAGIVDAMKTIEERTGSDPLETFEERCGMLHFSRSQGSSSWGATYQVPMEVRAERGTTLAMRWLIQFSRQRPGRTG